MLVLCPIDCSVHTLDRNSYDYSARVNGVVMDMDVDVDVELHSTDIRNRRGDRALRAIYGNTYDSLSKNLSTYHPCIWNIVRQSVYGYQLSRQILSLPEIECVSVTSLTAMNVPRQLRSHIRGAKHNHVPYDSDRYTFNLW
jgi:hypothetical protein